MFKIELDNTDNDKLMIISLPIVPRIGDWIKIDDVDFACDEDLLTVTHVILDPKSDIIRIVVTAQQ